MTDPAQQRLKKPEWLKVTSKSGAANDAVLSMLRALGLHTVCEEASCPNRGECFSRKTATFMILGSHCTRHCRFCAVTKECPDIVDPDEPARVADAVKQLGLAHVVITSVTRDDLSDGGARHFARTIQAVQTSMPGCPPTIEVLIPDFQGSEDALSVVVDAGPDVLNHNIETVPRLYPTVRPEADYRRSLDLLGTAKKIRPQILTKSGIMVGLGETAEEVIQVLQDLRAVGCDLLTIGQYLAPSKNHLPVVAYIHPDQFEAYKRQAEEMGFRHVASGPLVRSSYHADEALK